MEKATWTTAAVLLLAELALVSAIQADVGCDCPRTTRPNLVCGSDNTTYPDECSLRCAARDRQSGLQVLHQGRCAEEKERTSSDSAALFESCSKACTILAHECIASCKTDSCDDQCVFTYILDCNCGCGRHLKSPSAPLSKSLPPKLALGGAKVRFSNGAQAVIKCYNDYGGTTSSCLNECTRDDDACSTTCYLQFLSHTCIVCNSMRTDGRTWSSAASVQGGFVVTVAAALLASSWP